MPVPSPCIFVCQLEDEGDLCVGCFRTRTEILVWSQATEDERAEIVARAAARAESRSDTEPPEGP